jgi:hypothetical protein
MPYAVTRVTPPIAPRRTQRRRRPVVSTNTGAACVGGFSVGGFSVGGFSVGGAGGAALDAGKNSVGASSADTFRSGLGAVLTAAIAG